MGLGRVRSSSPCGPIFVPKEFMDPATTVAKAAWGGLGLSYRRVITRALLRPFAKLPLTLSSLAEQALGWFGVMWVAKNSKPMVVES